MGDAGWPPEHPSKSGSTFDERDLADEVESLGQGQRGYELLVADTRHLVSTPEFEISLVAAPANADTRILSYKSADPEEPERTPRPALTRDQQRIRDEWRTLLTLTAPLSSDPEVAPEREEKRQARQLRRQCDRLRLEESLGWDTDLIKKLGL